MSLISTFNETPLNEAYLAREIVQISGANTLIGPCSKELFHQQEHLHHQDHKWSQGFLGPK